MDSFFPTSAHRPMYVQGEFESQWSYINNPTTVNVWKVFIFQLLLAWLLLMSLHFWQCSYQWRKAVVTPRHWFLSLPIPKLSWGCAVQAEVAGSSFTHRNKKESAGARPRKWGRWHSTWTPWAASKSWTTAECVDLGIVLVEKPVQGHHLCPPVLNCFMKLPRTLMF